MQICCNGKIYIDILVGHIDDEDMMWLLGLG